MNSPASSEPRSEGEPHDWSTSHLGSYWECGKCGTKLPTHGEVPPPTNGCSPSGEDDDGDTASGFAQAIAASPRAQTYEESIGAVDDQFAVPSGDSGGDEELSDPNELCGICGRTKGSNPCLGGEAHGGLLNSARLRGGVKKGDCQHGSLARSCEVCNAEAERDSRLTKEQCREKLEAAADTAILGNFGRAVARVLCDAAFGEESAHA